MSVILVVLPVLIPVAAGEVVEKFGEHDLAQIVFVMERIGATKLTRAVVRIELAGAAFAHTLQI